MNNMDNYYQHPEQVAPNSIRKLSKVLSHVRLKMLDTTGSLVWDNIKRSSFTVHADLDKKGKWGEKEGVLFVFDENGHPWMCQAPDGDQLTIALKRSGYEESSSDHPIKNVKNAKIDDKNIWDALPSNKPKQPPKSELQVVEHINFADWVVKRSR